mmetsp:Transcript_38857/g.87505  ORF Transcript_38857/g.87505 Transcript_38857/m.87505 type:complete len:93 (-) Transcript_38857:178-456(-)
MITESAYTQIPGTLYMDKGDDKSGVLGPYGADKGISEPDTFDPVLSMHSAAFKANPASVQFVMERRQDVLGLAVGNFQSAAQKKVKAAIANK